jgi:hypothetical protein
VSRVLVLFLTGRAFSAKLGGMAMAQVEARPAERVGWSEGRGAAICARVAQGESLMAICREAGMPHRSTVQDWRAKDPGFEVALEGAMESARLARRRRDLALARRSRDPRGLWSTYTPEVGEAICARLAAGQTLVAIAREPWTPCYSTILNWARYVPEFADRYALARQLAVHALCDQVLELKDEITPQTVAEHRARFDMFRALAARIAPRKYLEPCGVAIGLYGGARDADCRSS